MSRYAPTMMRRSLYLTAGVVALSCAPAAGPAEIPPPHTVSVPAVTATATTTPPEASAPATASAALAVAGELPKECAGVTKELADLPNVAGKASITRPLSSRNAKTPPRDSHNQIKKPPRGHATIAELAAWGTPLDHAKRSIARLRIALRHCYERQFLLTVGTELEVTLRASIGPEGRVTKVAGFKDGDVAATQSCMIAAVRKGRFVKPDATPAGVCFTVKLRPRN